MNNNTVNLTNLISSFLAPKRIIINNFYFSLKDKLNNGNFSFRCMDRKNCNSIIHVN